MMINGLVLVAILAYVGLSVGQVMALRHQRQITSWPWWLLGLVAILCHAGLLYHWIDQTGLQNLDMFNMISLVLWMAGVMLFLTSLKVRVENLAVLTYPLAALSVMLVRCFPSQYLFDTDGHPKEIIHIWLGVMTLSLLCLAALQALFLALQAYRLRRQVDNVFTDLPPLLSMETLLFQLIWLGFIVLSLVLCSALVFFHRELDQWVFLQKMGVSLLAWLVYAILLAGRYFFGWRGRRAIQLSLIGFGLLLFAYFSSRLLGA